jgi:membrane-associated phospholipid phosphatase
MSEASESCKGYERLALVAGLGCLVATVLLGIAVGPHATKLDLDLTRVVRDPLDRRSYRQAVRLLASEGSWPHAAWAMALVPVGLAAALVAWDLRGRSWPARLGRWRWLPPVLVALPAQYLLRILLGRDGPRGPSWVEGAPGAYPSGAALLVALGWAVGVAVAWDLRPGWRRGAVAAAGVSLGLHALARVAAQKHWATDIVGSYLLVAGVLLVAVAARAAPSRG